MKLKIGKDLQKVILGTVAMVTFCSLAFVGLTQSAKATAVNATETVATKYSTTAGNSNLPAGYVKADYKVKVMKTDADPTVNTITAAAAAELGAQNLWRIFGADLSNQTVEMSYNAAGNIQSRAEWEGYVVVNDKLNYDFTVDAVTGEYRTTSQFKYWSGNIDVGMNKALMKDCSQYKALAKTVCEKYNVVKGKIVSVDYEGQGYSTNKNGDAKSPDIDIRVKTDSGDQAQLAFSRYNQELISIDYDGWVKDAVQFEQKMEKEAQNSADITHIFINEDEDGKISVSQPEPQLLPSK